MATTVSTRGERELALRFDTLPARVHKKLEQRITALTDALQARIEAAAPYKTGKLRSEVTGRVYAGQSDRVAGYVSIYSPGDSKEYPKAATLEYGTDKPRRSFERATKIDALFGRSRRRILSKVSRPVHIAAFAYLRGPFDSMRPEIQAALEEAIAEAAAEDDTT